jgi:uncharacterized protein YecA (UPF0149 family)
MKWDPPIRPIESGPLTDREIKELHAFLLAEDSLENPMDFYTFDGFICAVLSGPNTIMPSEWLRWVWDQKEGRATSGVYERETGEAHSEPADRARERARISADPRPTVL